MGKSTGISWTDHTFSAWWGCEQISPACDACYAKTWSERTGHGKSLPVIWGADAGRRFFSEKHWAAPLAWDVEAAKARRPAFVFVNSMSDTFERRPDLVVVRARLRRLVHSTRWLTYQLLTKRPENAQELWLAPLYPISRLTLKDRKGGDWSEWPTDLRIREYPRGAA